MMKLRMLVLGVLAVLGATGAAFAQEPLPPLQPPLPLAPPAMILPMAPIIVANAFEARLAVEDVIAALDVRGFDSMPVDDSWARGSYACLNASSADFACVREDLARLPAEGQALFAVVTHGRLDGETLVWTCVGREHIVTVDLALETFFSIDLKARNGVRNAALACMERAAGHDRWDQMHTLL